MFRGRLIVFALALSLLAGMMPAAARSQAQSGWLAPPRFVAQGGLEQIRVTDVEPGTRVGTARWADDSDGPALVDVRWAEADEQGSAMFRDVEPGVWVVGADLTIDWNVPVGAVEGSTPPQSFYDDQDLVEGFQYIETRDGTTLSAYVVLPGPIEDGPYPTVIEYSGYNPSDPISGLGSAAGGIDVTPLCGTFPTLCKAPAQPASQLAGLYGYAVVGVNVRGTGCSGGAYDFFETMQVLDGYDVVEAVAAQPWVEGNRVGMIGLSYPGITQLFVGQTNPPSLAAITPLSVYGDTGTGVLAPGGLLNTGFATSWADNVLDNSRPYGTAWVNELIADGDAECDQNQLLRLQNVDATAKARANPFYSDEVAAPLDTRTFVGDIDAAVLLASAFGDEQTGPSFGDLLGRFDDARSSHAIVYNGLHADGFSPEIISEWAAFLDIYVAEDVPAPRPGLDLLVSVFTGGIFGGAVPLPPDRWGDVGSHAEALARWESQPEIRVLMERGSGGDRLLPIAGWEFTAEQWPPSAVEAQRLYLSADGRLTSRPQSVDEAVSIRPNPDVATTHFWTSGSIWGTNPGYTWVPQARGEQARFQTDPLSSDVVMAGTASVDLWLRSDATNAELEAVLTEVTSAGDEVRVQAGQLEWAYRSVAPDSTELQPIQRTRAEDFALIEPGEWTFGRLQIPAFAHAFREGSSIRLTINTPGGDTARWEFELDGPGAEATHLIATSEYRASSIVLPVMTEAEVPTPLPACGALRGQPCRPAPPIDNVIVAPAEAY